MTSVFDSAPFKSFFVGGQQTTRQTSQLIDSIVKYVFEVKTMPDLSILINKCFIPSTVDGMQNFIIPCKNRVQQSPPLPQNSMCVLCVKSPDPRVACRPPQRCSSCLTWGILCKNRNKKCQHQKVAI